MKKTTTQSWRLIAAEIIAATKADPDSLRNIYDDQEFRPRRNASTWAQLAARLAQARKAYREAVAKGCQRDVQHNMLRRCFAHDYNMPGSYMITMAVPNRGSNPFGTVKGDIRSGRKAVTVMPDEVARYASLSSEQGPLRMELTSLGAAIHEALHGITDNYPMVKIHKAQLMPDHLHLILTVTAPIVSSNGIPRHLGHVIAGFKKGCNHAYWALCYAGEPHSTTTAQRLLKNGAERLQENGAERLMKNGAERFPRSAKLPSNARTGRPSLWAEGYTDTIILSRKHMTTEEAYLDDNIYRLRMKQLHRDLFRKVHHIRINGQDYAALGNIHLLRTGRKVQVQYHHWEQDVPAGYLPCDRTWHCQCFYASAQLQHADPSAQRYYITGTPIQGMTEAEAHTQRLLNAGDEGAIFVSPFISETEKALRDAALTMGIAYIRLTREGFRDLYTPTKSEFEACCEGNLLLIAPWADRQRTATITRRECMELNHVAATLSNDDLQLMFINDDNNDTTTITPREDEQ